MRRVRVRLRGIVQGVGFRPFVHNLAARLHLAGYVLNSSAGLVAEVEGGPAAVERFLEAVSIEAPPLAWIQEMEVTELAPAGETNFEIRHSAVETGEFALISPDVATCPDCLRDFTEPGNRRFEYPFTNCTNCGPRYTIIRDIPYDRASTTMAPFRMCADCQREYDDPGNRRFHAQPNACAVCGPWLTGGNESEAATLPKVSPSQSGDRAPSPIAALPLPSSRAASPARPAASAQHAMPPPDGGVQVPPFQAPSPAHPADRPENVTPPSSATRAEAVQVPPFQAPSPAHPADRPDLVTPPSSATRSEAVQVPPFQAPSPAHPADRPESVTPSSSATRAEAVQVPPFQAPSPAHPADRPENVTPSSSATRAEGVQVPPFQAPSPAHPADRPENVTPSSSATCSEAEEDPGSSPVAGAHCNLAASALTEARARLAAGEILAIKGLGGFHLACDPRNAGAVERLRARKRRSDKPFAIMARDLAIAESLCEVSDADRISLLGWRRPIVLLPRRPEATLPEAIAPRNRTLGVMLPYTPLHHLLFAGAPFDALVMTSGNLSEEPIVVNNQEAHERIGRVADWFLTHNRDIYMRADDSVVRTFEGRERVLRRSRGYAPQTLDLGRTVPELLACGGELKNAFCLTKGRHAIMSQHVGDLENYETLLFFEETLANLKKLFRVEPRTVAHDLHPLYLSTKYALELEGIHKIGVQHHHAHIASCMAENGLAGEVIGVAFDGTGYGTDGAIWGGEFLVAGYAAFERRAHLRYVSLAGGDAAVRQPWRMALAYLIDTFGPDVAFPAARQEHVRVVRRMIATGVNTALTSSCGRLFDAVASLIGLRHEVSFEGQAAIELEMIAEKGNADRYPYGIVGDGPWEVDFRPAIEALVSDVATGISRGVMSAKFHNTLADATVEVCRRIGQETALRRVCLSGGTFQNVRLMGSTAAGLRACGFEVFLHALVPPNDGGIALGQAAIAARAQK